MAYSNGLFAQAGIPDNDLTLASVGMLGLQPGQGVSQPFT